MRCFSALAFCVVTFALLNHSVVAVEPASEQVKAVAKRYAQIEEQLARSVRYEKREEAGGVITVKQAWFNGAGDLLKVTTDRTSAEGRELNEYTPLDPDLTDDGMFVFTRREKPSAEGGTDVEETRCTYGQAEYPNEYGGRSMTNGVLIRELRKSAHFPTGLPLEMAGIASTTTKLPKVAAVKETDEMQKARWEFFGRPEKIGAELRAAGPPATDPFAGVKGDAERFRLIRGTASPDGRFALAIGFEKAVDWSSFLDKDLPDEEVFTAEDSPELENYVVELATQRILGATEGGYFGTRRRYNHRTAIVTWSDDAAFFVQVYHSKWSYETCRAGKIGPGPKLVGTVDLGESAEKFASSFLKRKGRRAEGAIAIQISEVKTNGTIVLTVTGQEATVPRKGEINFRVEETLRLTEKAGAVRLEHIKTRLLPNEY